MEQKKPHDYVVVISHIIWTIVVPNMKERRDLSPDDAVRIGEAFFPLMWLIAKYVSVPEETFPTEPNPFQDPTIVPIPAFTVACRVGAIRMTTFIMDVVPAALRSIFPVLTSARFSIFFPFSSPNAMVVASHP